MFLKVALSMGVEGWYVNLLLHLKILSVSLATVRDCSCPVLEVVFEMIARQLTNDTQAPDLCLNCYSGRGKCWWNFLGKAIADVYVSGPGLCSRPCYYSWFLRPQLCNFLASELSQKVRGLGQLSVFCLWCFPFPLDSHSFITLRVC